MIILEFIIGYLSLYLIIYMHEVGHALFYQAYGCKKNALCVTVKPYLFFSTPEPVDEKKVDLLSSKQNILAGYGGIMINLLSAALMFAAISLTPASNQYWLLFQWMFFSLHMAEAVSYMLIGNIYLVSDMANIAYENKNLRIVNFIIGILLTIIYVNCLIKCPSQALAIVITFNAIALVAMGVGRIIFTYMGNKRNA